MYWRLHPLVLNQYFLFWITSMFHGFVQWKLLTTADRIKSQGSERKNAPSSLDTGALLCFATAMQSVSASVNSSVIDEVRELEKLKMKPAPAETAGKKALLPLSNGQQIDPAEWNVVLFMASDCSYCKRFGPVLKKVSENTGVNIFAYTGAAAQSAGRVAEGNYAFNNMQMENVQGNKWDTNRSYAAGANTQQLENGAMVTQTAGGAMVANTAPAMSNLATNINFAKMQQSMAQQQYRQSESETQTRLEGWRSDSAQTFQQLQSFAHRHGDNFSRGIDSREGSNSQVSEGTQKMMDAVQSYARSHGVSEAVAFSELERKSKEGYADGHVSVEAGKSGVVGLLGKAVGVEASVGGSAGLKASTGSEATVTQSGNADETTRESNDARLSQSFSEGWSMVKSASYDTSASQVESDGMDQLKQVQQSMQQTDSHYQDYNRSKAHTEELSRMASMSDSESATVSSNLSQEFVSWMQGRNPAEAQQLLTNTDSAENREQLAQYANEFVSERVKGRMEQHNHTALAGGETGFQANPQYVSGQSTQEQNQPVTQSGARRESGGLVNPLHVSGQSAQEQNHPVTLSSENQPYSQPTQAVHSGSAVESPQSGASRPAEAPQPFNSAKHFEDARNAMQSESNPFRQDVVVQQQQNQSTIDQNGANQGSQKELIETQRNELKNDVSSKSEKVGEDIRKAQEHQELLNAARNPADLENKANELLPPQKNS